MDPLRLQHLAWVDTDDEKRRFETFDSETFDSETFDWFAHNVSQFLHRAKSTALTPFVLSWAWGYYHELTGPPSTGAC